MGDRIERQEQVRRTVANLRQKADLYQSKLNMQKLLKESGGAMPDSECGGMPDIIGGSGCGFEFPEPIINYEEEERQQDDDEATKSENDHEEISEEVEDALAIKLEETVHSLEAKCAGVREELGRMALSEQYMRTKQAQLKARRKKRKPKEAMIKAELREKEAADMREKVQGMMKLLAERRNKLKITETVITKKANVVDNVNKIMNQKEIRVKQKQRQKDELLAFGKKPPK